MGEYYDEMNRRLNRSIENCSDCEQNDEGFTEMCERHVASQHLLNWSIGMTKDNRIDGILINKICMGCGMMFKTVHITQYKCLGCFTEVFRSVR